MSKMKKNNSRQQFANTRKVLRKQKRQQKKVHRQEHYMKKKTIEETPKYTPGKFVKRPAESLEPDIKSKKRKKDMSQPLLQDIIKKERQKELKEAAQLQSQMEEQRRKQLLQANEDEDKMIKKLEKQLGLNKCKNKKNYFTDDGLDYLLEICDRTTSEQIVAAEKHLAEVEGESDFEEDLAAVTGREVPSKKDKQKKQKADKNNDDESNEVDLDEDDEGDDNSEGIDDDNSGEDYDDGKSEEEFGNDGSEGEFDDDDEMSGPDEDDMLDSEPEEKPTKSKKTKETNISSEITKDSAPTKTKSKERIIKADELSKVFSDDEVSHLSGDDDLEGFSSDEDNDNEEVKEKPDVWEDIYGRKRDKEGNVIKEEKGVYVPPHLRNKDSGSDKELAQLNRQIKSVLNKLAGTNLHWACSSMEALYSSHSRHAVSSALARLWLEAVGGAAATPDRMVAEHAALVAALHANVGSEIGAHFLQELTKRFDEMMQTSQPVKDKTLDNLVSCLAHLYSFKIYHASLLYDIFGRLLEQLTEKNIECVLVALRSVGGVLRKEEPLALKTFIHDTQARVAAATEEAADGSRIKFLLEVLMAVKNNNLSKIPNYEPTYAEQLKKGLRGVVRKGNYVTPLNIRLEDLLKAEERGKWWVVGSAWEGTRTLPAEKPRAAPRADQELLELARRQRMNTDVRRNIFCVIMAAEDYMDAFEKLQHLGLRGQQQREVVHVLLACCLQERTFNPYYAVLARQLCDTDRKYQLSIQYATWDKIKELETLPKHSAANLAQLLVHLIVGKGLALSVLKVIQFSDLNKHTVRFMRQILLAIIMGEDLQASIDVFRRVAKPPALRMFRESVRLFVRHFLGRGKRSNVLTDEEGKKLDERIAEVEKILTMHENKMML